MPERLITVDDIRSLNSAHNIASLFRKIGYNAELNPIDIDDLQLSPQSTAAIYDAHLIADQGDGKLQILLFQLQPEEWDSPSRASSRMKAIASQVGRRPSEFLLLATKDYSGARFPIFYVKTKYLEPFSIPSTSETVRLATEALVQKCLNAKGIGVEEWEAAIDDRVAHLYAGLFHSENELEYV